MALWKALAYVQALLYTGAAHSACWVCTQCAPSPLWHTAGIPSLGAVQTEEGCMPQRERKGQ